MVYGRLPTAEQLSRWEEAVMRHSALPVAVEATLAALPHDAHPMGVILTGLAALSTCHPEQVGPCFSWTFFVTLVFLYTFCSQQCSERVLLV